MLKIKKAYKIKQLSELLFTATGEKSYIDGLIAQLHKRKCSNLWRQHT